MGAHKIATEVRREPEKKSHSFINGLVGEYSRQELGIFEGMILVLKLLADNQFQSEMEGGGKSVERSKSSCFASLSTSTAPLQNH